MKAVFLFVCVSCVTVILNLDVRGQSESDDQVKLREEIQQILDLQVEAWNDGNVDKFMETYWKSEKLSFSSGGKTTRGWQATLDRYKIRYDTREKMGTLSFDELEVSALGADHALVLGNWNLQRENDEPHGNFSLILKRFDNGWKIIHDHSSSLEE